MRTPFFVFLLIALAGALGFAGGGFQEIPPHSSSTTIGGLPAAPQAVPIPEGWKVFYDKDEIEMVEIGQGIRRGVVAGKTISISVDELDPQLFKGAPPSEAHHHSHEQADLGLQGTMEVYVDGKRSTVGPMQISVTPSDASHTVTKVMGPGKVVSLEFSTVRREDLMSHRPQITFKASPEPKPVSAGHTVFADFNKMPWVNVPGMGGMKAVFGQSMSLFMWSITPDIMEGAYATGHHHDIEQISYIYKGHCKMRVGDQIRALGPGSIIRVPANVDHPPLEAINNEDVVIIDFQPVIRQDLRELLENQS